MCIMNSKVTVSIIVYLTVCMTVSQEVGIDDVIDEIFNSPFYVNGNKAIGRLDLMIIKNVASSSRYNFVLSPLCLKMALYSLAEIAIGNTRAELISVLGEELNDATKDTYSKMITDLIDEKKYFGLGSHIFVSDDLEPTQMAVQTAKRHFGTHFKTVNTRDPYEAVSYINLVVLNMTKGTVHDSFNEYDVTNMAMLVLNTVFFEGYFRHTFAPNETTVKPFYISPTVPKHVDFMHVVNYFSFLESSKLDAKILGMAYTRVLIYFIVPNTLTGLNRVVENISLLGDELNNITKTYVDVTLPKFKLTYTSRLNGLLKRLGVEEAFQDKAQFSNLGRNKLQSNWLKISSIMQRFEFGINEYGSGVQPRGGVSEEGPFNATAEIVADRPFLFVIEQTSVKKIVLIGRVTDPSVSQGFFEMV